MTFSITQVSLKKWFEAPKSLVVDTKEGRRFLKFEAEYVGPEYVSAFEAAELRWSKKHYTHKQWFEICARLAKPTESQVYATKCALKKAGGLIRVAFTDPDGKIQDEPKKEDILKQESVEQLLEMDSFLIAVRNAINECANPDEDDTSDEWDEEEEKN